ncbi:hypothetical protein GH714_010309 [Hevea brasiliensis]|uniref:Uncharacterized protein n=1 Tax=Hevea brasiliensis TaxID=3981 RepID=A0A6A6MXS0_HEVBR|nr:hypothetical protein GH714_010309 [Hevea brasiliensis]
MSSTFSPSRNSHGSSRLQLHQLAAFGSASRLRSSSLKKPPEPLRHAIADCLSSAAASAVAISHHANPSVAVTEASRTLRDYLASPATTDLAYIQLLPELALHQESLPSLSSLLSRSFNSQLSPANAGESSEKKDATNLPISNLSNFEKVDAREDLDYIAADVLKWYWVAEHSLSFLSAENGRSVDLQDMSIRNFLELGAAALLVGDMEAKMKGQPWKYFGTADMPYLDQLLQPSSFTTVTNSASARSHLRAITASKRRRILLQAHFAHVLDHCSSIATTVLHEIVIL